MHFAPSPCTSFLLEDPSMRKPMTARHYAQRLGLLAAVVSILSACNADSSTIPAATPTDGQTTILNPGAPSSQLYGVDDGVYVVTFDPKRDQNFSSGKNSLVIPGNAVCDLETSGYGAEFWDAPCTPEKDPVTMTITIKNSNTDHPLMDFQPAMRFNPAKTVQLSLFVKKATQSDATNWIMLYCSMIPGERCIDESLTDPSLVSMVDRRAHLVFRRIKHFSGYVIAGGRAEEGDSTSAGQ
jgi:hypothetical protein